MRKMLLLGVMGLVACSGDDPSDSGTGGGGGSGSGGGYASYICYPEEVCDTAGVTCKTDPANVESGILICDGDDFVTTCEVGYFCSDDGSTPEQFPGCTSKAQVDLTCDVTNNVLTPIDGSGGGGGAGGAGGA